MKFQISRFPEKTGPCDLVVVFIDIDSNAKFHLSERIQFPPDLSEKINQSLYFTEIKNKQIKLRLFTFPDHQIKRLLLIKSEPDLLENPQAMGTRMADTWEELKKTGIKTAHIYLPFTEKQVEKYALAMVEIFTLQNYDYTGFKPKSKPEDKSHLNKIQFFVPESSDRAQLKHKINRMENTAKAVNFSRKLADMPGNVLTPSVFAREVKNRFKKSTVIQVKILTEPEIQKLKMNAFLGVSRGSTESPRLIVIHYRPKYKNARHLLLVGKGITFDSGGISLKPSDKMEEMKYDMAGAAAVVGIMSAIENFVPDMNVTALVPAAENMPDAAALKPGDVIRACNGKSIEIINTDAEGRLLLADVLAYGVKKYKPDWVIDLATLTGSVVVALGSHATGLFTNNEDLAKSLNKAGKVTGEKVWRMPLWDAYKKELESDIADLKNVGGREAGSITAAKFLEEFVNKTPWAHLDIAGTAYDQKHLPYLAKGASGVGVRLILALISILSDTKN